MLLEKLKDEASEYQRDVIEEYLMFDRVINKYGVLVDVMRRFVDSLKK